MAYGLKYYLDYCNTDKVERRLEILERGYSGSSFPVSSADVPFRRVTRNEDDSKLTEIQTTSARFNLYEDENINIDSLLNSDESKYLVKHYIDGFLDCQLFIVPDLYSSNIDGNSVIEFTATDKLPSLKDKSFAFSEGSVSYISVITEILNSTGVSLDVNVIANFTCDEWTLPAGRAANLFQDTFVWKERLFDSSGRSISMYDTLKSIMAQFYCRVYMSNNEWWIVNKEEGQIGGGRRIRFNSTGVFLGEDNYDFLVKNINDVDSGGYKEVNPVFSVASIYAENGAPLQLLKNRKFQGFASGSFPNWTNKSGYSVGSTTSDPKRYSISNGTVTEDELLLSPVPSLLQNTNGTDVLNHTQPHMESDAIIVPGTDNKVKFSITLRGANDTVVYVMVIAKVTRGGSSIVQYSSLNGDGQFAKFDPNVANTNAFLAFTLKQEMRDGASWGGSAVEMTFDVEGLIANTTSGDSVTEVFVRVYGVKRPAGRPYQTNLKNISVQLTTQNAGQIKGTIFQSIMSGDYSYKVDPQTAIFNDYVGLSRAATTSQGTPNGVRMGNTSSLSSIMHAADKKLTANWSYKSYPKDFQIIHTINQISRSYGASHYKLTISADSASMTLHTIVSICGVRYMVLSYEIDYLRDEVELVVAKCMIADVETTDVIFGYMGGDNDGVSGVNSISNIGSGSGTASPSPQDLQVTTEQGNTTTLPIKARGFRPTHFQGIPKVSPLAEDMEVGEWYMHVNPTAPAGETPTPGSDFYIKTANDANLSGIADGQLVSWSGSQGKFVPASFPSLTGYATQAWVNSQGFATQSWVNSQGFITGESDTLQSVLNRGNSSTTGFTINGEGSLSTYIFSAFENVAVGFKYKWYNDEWIVGNKRGDSANSLGFAFKYNGSEKALLDNSGVLYLNSGNSTQWNTAYTHSQTQGNPHNTQFSQLLNKPTTLAGFGIADGVTKGEFDGVNISNTNLLRGSRTWRVFALFGVTATGDNLQSSTEPSGQIFRLTNIIRTVGDYVFYIPTGNDPEIAYLDRFSGKELIVSIRLRTNNAQVVELQGAVPLTSMNADTTFKDFSWRFSTGFAGNMHFLLTGAGLSTVEVSSIKITQSSKPSFWSLAPEDVLSLGINSSNQFSHYTNWLSQGAGTGVMLNSGASRMELFTQQNSGGLYFRGGTDSAWGSVGRVWSSLDWTVDVNASANTVTQRDGFGDLRARYFIDTNGSVLSSGIASIYGGSGSGSLNKYTYQAVNQFLKMPAEGDTLQSIMERGNRTGAGKEIVVRWANDAGFLFIGGNENYSRIGSYHGALGWSSLIINEGGGSVFIGKTTGSAKLDVAGTINADGRITAPVIKAATLIIPTTAPTGLNAGEWGIYISPTI